MSIRTKIFLTFALFSYFPALAQVDTAWVRWYEGLWLDINIPTSLALDKDGNMYVAGYTNTTFYNLGTIFDYVVLKYAPNGDELWVRNYNGPSDSSDIANDIAVDKDGNVYVTGSSQGSGSDLDFATIKYASNGDTLWVRRYNGPENSSDEARALAVDDSGYVYVTGGYSSGIETGADYATIKYAPDGDTVWVRRYNGIGNSQDEALALAIDGTGNVNVTGYSGTIQYFPNGDTAWVRSYGGSALAVDVLGNVYVVGSSTVKYFPNGDTAWVKSKGGVSMAVDKNGNVFTANTVNFDYETFKYAPNGDSLWVRYYYSPTINGEDWAKALTLDKDGNSYITGSSWVYDTGYVFATIKYSPNGNTLWVRREFPCGFFDQPVAIAVDNNESIYITGYSETFEPPSAIITIKYTQCLAKPGDADGDSTIQISDVVAMVNSLFKGQPALNPSCLGDVNADGKVLLSDIVYLINYLFKSGPAPVKSRECCL